LRRMVAKTGVVRIRGAPKPRMPLFFDPGLWPAGQLGDMVVLDSCEVPTQPGYRVRVFGGPKRQLLSRQPVHRCAEVLVNPVQSVDDEIFTIHWLASLPAEIAQRMVEHISSV
jgi:hypothetical protein